MFFFGRTLSLPPIPVKFGGRLFRRVSSEPVFAVGAGAFVEGAWPQRRHPLRARTGSARSSGGSRFGLFEGLWFFCLGRSATGCVDGPCPKVRPATVPHSPAQVRDVQAARPAVWLRVCELAARGLGGWRARAGE